MKFIVDAQLPKSLSQLLVGLGYDSIHTLDLPDKNKSTDHFINQISKDQNRIVITKDRDFLESFLINGTPKKLLIVRTGNITNDQLLLLFKKNIQLISDLLQRSSLVELNSIEIIQHQ